MKKQTKEPLEAEIIETNNGRPPKFSQEYVDKLTNLMGNGRKSIAAICTYLNISQDTHYRWKEEHETYKQAYDKGIMAAQVWWEEMGIKGIRERDFKPAMYIFTVCNLFPETFKQYSAESNTNINLSFTKPLSLEELDKEIAQKQETIKLLEINKK